MAAPIKITRPVAPGGKYPKLKVEFRGADQAPFFSFRRIALANFNSDATSLARRLILDFEKEYKEFPNSNRVRRLQQMLNLDLDKKESGK